ncbi:MAG: hypothetical protein CMJ46_09825 [Planctomyces sp.]|nr:hypothetical protein [Planctomyces sp.]
MDKGEQTQIAQANPTNCQNMAATNRSLPLAIVIAMLFGFLSGLSWDDHELLQAAPSGNKAPAAFESGGARAAKTLDEIKTILQRMDGRLEKIEKQVGGGR